MKRLHLLFFLFSALLAGALPSAASAARLEPAPDFSLEVPNDWDSIRGDFKGKTPKAVSDVFECVDEDASLLKMVGWKLDKGSGAVQAAYCVSYSHSGGGKSRELLKGSQGKDRDEAFQKFANIFASKIEAGYRKRNVVIEELSADLLSAAEQVIMVLDCRIKFGGRTYMRSDTVMLRNDTVLNVSAIYDIGGPQPVREQSDAIPMSVEWKR